MDTEPVALAVVEPTGTCDNAQHVPVQLTRFPTTVENATSTGAFGVRPPAVSETFVSTVPLVALRVAVAPDAELRPAVVSVVVGPTVGVTLFGQSTYAFGGPASFVTVNDMLNIGCHGCGD